MKQLILFRHAKSSWRDRQLPDNERPLSGRGEKDAPLMAARLAARGERPALILSSHARRALATARIVARALDVLDENVRIDRRLYLASPDAILGVLGEQERAIGSLLVIGHNPGLTELANRLVPALAVDNLPTSGVVGIAVDAPSWSDIVPSACRLLYHDYPKNVAS